MKKIFALIFVALVAVSCGPDNPTNPVKHDISGFWRGESILTDGKLRVELTISGPILEDFGGYGRFVFEPKDTTAETTEFVIIGEYFDPSVEFEIVDVDDSGFDGELIENARKIAGKISTPYADSVAFTFEKIY